MLEREALHERAALQDSGSADVDAANELMNGRAGPSRQSNEDNHRPGRAGNGTGAWRYHAVNLSIEKGAVGPGRGLVIVVTAIATMMCGAMIAYMLLTWQHA